MEQQAERPVLKLPSLWPVRCKVGTQLELFDAEGARKALIGGDGWFVLSDGGGMIRKGAAEMALSDTEWRAFQAEVRKRYGVDVPNELRPTRLL